jgi:Flp pilus assembly pilin Flp
MTNLVAILKRLRKSRAGQGIVEYALILVLVVTVLVTALSTIGHRNPGGNPMENVAQAIADGP